MIQHNILITSAPQPSQSIAGHWWAPLTCTQCGLIEGLTFGSEHLIQYTAAYEQKTPIAPAGRFLRIECDYSVCLDLTAQDCRLLLAILPEWHEIPSHAHDTARKTVRDPAARLQSLLEKLQKSVTR